jgi:phosphoribosylaminoimidazole-succinocarboxamide synthase
MNILIQHDKSSGERGVVMAQRLASRLTELGFEAAFGEGNAVQTTRDFVLRLSSGLDTQGNHHALVALNDPETLLERALRVLPLDFSSLPLLTEGESKIVRAWTDKVVVMRFKPTVYSFTANRYGVVPGTDIIRARFTAALFRLMATASWDGATPPRSAFLAEIASTDHVPLIVEERVEDCNLETRIKRYHIGSPVHRYRFTEKYPTTHGRKPISRWSHLDTPVVCFDWRHPLTSEGERLADEPLSDDYAALWLDDVSYAKEMARQTFLWMEKMFADNDLRLIDMCLFIDRKGRTLYGEISPDCMRVRFGLGDPSQADAADKDLWRTGRAPNEVRRRYQELYQRLFASHNKEEGGNNGNARLHELRKPSHIAQWLD